MAKKSAAAPVVRMAKVADLVPYVNNPRKHPEEQISTLAAAIREFGFLSPIVTDGEDGLLAGHGRLLAAQKLKLDEVPVIEASHLTPAQRKAYILADNKIAEQSRWDEELLLVELDSLTEFGYDLSLTGLNTFELDELRLGWQTDIEDEEEMKDFPEDTSELLATIKVKCPESNSGDVLELLKQAINQAGLTEVTVAKA